MFGVPTRTEFDLNFRFLGIPVVVHPLFWLIMALLGWSMSIRGDSVDGRLILIFVLCAFVSILMHEYGHALTTKYFGGHPGIMLYGLGGFTTIEPERHTPWQNLAILIAGPGAGFALCGLTFYLLISGNVPLGEFGRDFLGILFIITLFWNVINLLPVYPMDGGRILGIFLIMFNPRHGRRWMHTVSLVVGGSVAALAAIVFRLWFLAILLAILAMQNYTMLQALHEYARYGTDDDDDNWWRR